MKSKREVFLTGIIIGVLLMLGVSLGGDIYKKFAWGGHQTFEIMIANDLFREDAVMPEDVAILTRQFGEVMGWGMSRALPMKDKKNFKKLGELLLRFNKYDQEYYTRWLENRRSESSRKKFAF